MTIVLLNGAVEQKPVLYKP